MEIFKTCTKCKRVLPLSSFYRNHRHKDGHHYECKECHNQSVQISKAKRKARAEKSEHELLFSLTNAGINEIIDELRKRGYSGELRYTKTISI